MQSHEPQWIALVVAQNGTRWDEVGQSALSVEVAVPMQMAECFQSTRSGHSASWSGGPRPL